MPPKVVHDWGWDRTVASEACQLVQARAITGSLCHGRCGRQPGVGSGMGNAQMLSYPRFPRPVTVEPMDQLDDEEGLPEKLVIKNQQFHK